VNVNLAQLLPLVLQISIGLMVFCVALEAEPGDVTYLLRRPSLMLRSLLSMNVVMPILAVLIAVLCRLRPELKVALILLAVSPVPPVLPNKHAKAGANVSYGIGLLLFAAVLSLVTVPLSVALITSFFGRTVQIPTSLVAKVLGFSVIAALILGAIVRRLAPSFERFAKPLSKLATAIVLVAMVPILLTTWRAIVREIGDFTIIAIALFTLAGLAVGHLLGGPDSEDRTVLALSTASRHPGVALALAGAVAEDKAAVSAAVLLAVLVTSVVTAPYVKWRRRIHAPVAAPAPTTVS
jgi:predicted Na+-dependent transporter